MKILFVATKKNGNPADRELYEMDFMNELLGFKRSLFDLGLLTVAAATPEGVEVELVDEYVDPIPYETTDADLVALSAKTSCVSHAYEVAGRFKRRGVPVVLGGIHASLRPEEALEHVDYVVVGEAERTWPEFVNRFRRGEAPQITRETDFPPMDMIPVPAWDRIDPKHFLFHQIQTTRGCPYTCRFCSVPDISGSTFRFKPVENVVKEIRALPSAGPLKDRLKALYVVDDNFISRLKYTKELLEALVPLHRSGELGEWSAETTLNVAKDEELLDLFAAAGCSTLIIGFESVSEVTLLDMKKKVNFSLSYPEAIGRIHARGMSVVGNFIVGFDTDTLSVFREILEFVDRHTILYPFFSILTPMPGTQLYEEFRANGRLDHTDWARYDTRHVVFGPKHMTREQLMDGYIWLYEQAYTTTASLDRLERYWRLHRRRASTAVERGFVKWKLRPFEKSGTERFKRVLADGWRRLSAKGVRSDVGQLLYYYDSAHFVDFLGQFKSKAFDENVRIFSTHRSVEETEKALDKKQWDRKRKLPIAEATARE
ncbi:MAG: B12-binding domain-containing radical SAM protein [Deltaproteobacteria bacterium]|nr:B12-binding domain-containing radical SAM protein [Deltaproteobacteria bacterium]